MRLTVTPSVVCWWPVFGEVLAKVTEAAWYRVNIGFRLNPADVDGQYEMTDGVQHYAGAPDWGHARPSAMWKLAAGTAYTCELTSNGRSGGTWQYYRGGGVGQGHLFMFSPGTVPR